MAGNPIDLSCYLWGDSIDSMDNGKKQKMTNYSKCGHKTDGVIILDDNVMSLLAYEEWSNTIGVFGDKTICWECWCKSQEKNLKGNER